MRPHERSAANRRRMTAYSAAKTQRQNHQKAVFAAAAKTMSLSEPGAPRKGPPRANHQIVTPGSTKAEIGSRTTDAMTAPEASHARMAALVNNKAAAVTSDQRRIIRLVMLTNDPS